jgi:hypothetical protein
MHVPKPVIVGLFTAVGLFGVGVAAATVDPEDGKAGGDDGKSEAPVERYYGPECGEEISDGTHGDYVRRAAHDSEGDVRAVARSDCGKPRSEVLDKPARGGPKGHPHGGPPGQMKEKGKPVKS